MTVQEALEIVLNLARLNVCDECELPEEYARQIRAIEIVETTDWEEEI